MCKVITGMKMVEADVVEDEVVDEVVNPETDDVVDKPDHDESDDVPDDVDEAVILDHRRSGMLILTPMASHTGVGLLMQEEVVEPVVIQDDEDDENDVIEYL